jgi:hypothetical protein
MGEIQLLKKKTFWLENLKVCYQLVVTAVGRDIRITKVQLRETGCEDGKWFNLA